MGNCAASRHAGESWTDDGEWDEDEASASKDGDHHHHDHHASEVTIRITKRQLHELMERKTPGGRGSSTRQLLADILDSGEVHHPDLHREEHWKPALQSIPEVVES